MDIKKDDSYYFQIEDFVLHKKFVLQSGLILVQHLLSENKDDLAMNLMKRLSVHDNSKLETQEFEMLCQIPNDKSSFTNANTQLNELMRKSIELHWKNNRHHPEYFKDINEMSELDLMEMCCDWKARSLQYETDFLDFVKTRQENRFHFSDKVFQKIWKYCLILEEK